MKRNITLTVDTEIIRKARILTAADMPPMTSRSRRLYWGHVS